MNEQRRLNINGPVRAVLRGMPTVVALVVGSFAESNEAVRALADDEARRARDAARPSPSARNLNKPCLGGLPRPPPAGLRRALQRQRIEAAEGFSDAAGEIARHRAGPTDVAPGLANLRTADVVEVGGCRGVERLLKRGLAPGAVRLGRDMRRHEGVAGACDVLGGRGQRPRREPYYPGQIGRGPAGRR